MCSAVSNLQLKDDQLEEEGQLLWRAVTPFSPRDFKKDYYPMYTLPPSLTPSTTVRISDIRAKLFYGLIAPIEVFVSYVSKHQVFYADTTCLASEFGEDVAMREAAKHLGRKHHRLLTTCDPMMADGVEAGFIGLFTNVTAPWFWYTWGDADELLAKLKQDLGICEEAEGVWVHAAADFDFQELIRKPDLKLVEAKRAKLRKRAMRSVKERKGLSDTLTEI